MMVQPFKKVNKKPIIPREQHLCLYIIRNRYILQTELKWIHLNVFSMTDIIDVPFISLRIKIFLTPIFQNWTHLKVFFDDGYQRFFIYFLTHKNISNTLSENVFFKGTNQKLIFVFFKIPHLFFKVGRKTIKLIFSTREKFLQAIHFVYIKK